MAETFQQWCFEAHANTNHLYYDYIPYRFHLEMVLNIVRKYEHITKKLGIELHVIEAAAVGHDIIEDTRKTYNDVFKELCRHMTTDDARDTANIIFAVTNNTGRTRAERADAAYYDKIRKTPGAVLIKLCDRMANVKFGKLVGGRMVKVYYEEQQEFIRHLFTFFDGTKYQTSGFQAIYQEVIENLDKSFFI